MFDVRAPRVHHVARLRNSRVAARGDAGDWRTRPRLPFFLGWLCYRNRRRHSLFSSRGRSWSAPAIWSDDMIASGLKSEVWLVCAPICRRAQHTRKSNHNGGFTPTF
jgi:hypothetical protein